MNYFTKKIIHGDTYVAVPAHSSLGFLWKESKTGIQMIYHESLSGRWFEYRPLLAVFSVRDFRIG